MPKVRLLTPWTNDKGEPQAAGAVVDVSDDEATALNNAGRASKLDDEKALEQQNATSAVYDARLTREAAPTSRQQEEPPPKKK